MGETYYIIYNASGSVVGELKYIAGHLIGVSKCAACELTHSFKEMGEKSEFKACRLRLNVDIQLIHKNELKVDMKKYIEENTDGLPLMLKYNGDYTTVFTAKDFEGMKGSVTDFEKKFLATLES